MRIKIVFNSNRAFGRILLERNAIIHGGFNEIYGKLAGVNDPIVAFNLIFSIAMFPARTLKEPVSLVLKKRTAVYAAKNTVYRRREYRFNEACYDILWDVSLSVVKEEYYTPKSREHADWLNMLESKQNLYVWI